jgi:hypothetical protein
MKFIKKHIYCKEVISNNYLTGFLIRPDCDMKKMIGSSKYHTHSLIWEEFI